jgi:hypothetical protein
MGYIIGLNLSSTVNEGEFQLPRRTDSVWSDREFGQPEGASSRFDGLFDELIAELIDELIDAVIDEPSTR